MMRLFLTSEHSTNAIFQYFLGFQPSDGRMILDEHTLQLTVLLDARYINKQLPSSKKGYKIHKVLRTKKITDHLEDILLSHAEILLENSLPYSVVETLKTWSQQYLGKNVFQVEKKKEGNTSKLSRQQTLRGIKSPEEQQKILAAQAFTHEMWAWVEKLIDSGAIFDYSEIGLRGELIRYAFSLGAEDEAFPVIVASGVHTSIPHHSSGSSKIQSGPFLLDMGWKLNAYCSDFTRSMWIGEMPQKESARYEDYVQYQHILQHCKEANRLAQVGIKTGIKASELDAIARNYLKRNALEQYFIHSLGHGVGVEVHESPSISSRSDEILQAGMVITIEPGIYLPEKYGVRWEDVYVIR